MFRLLPFLLVLSACGDTAILPTAAPAQTDSCGAAQFDTLIGQPLGDGGPFLESGVTYRVIYPGSIVTLDFDPDRVNVNVSEEGIIQSVGCG